MHLQTAIYGSRGSNGVILITTKKGTKGKVAFSYSGNVSFDSYKIINGTGWMVRNMLTGGAKL
jgi:hypothetical protein